MNQEVKQKWIEALRSGKYKQGRESLRNDSGYCCLGVLCDLYKKETNKGEWITVKDSVFKFVFKDQVDESFSTLTTGVRDWADLKETNPWVQNSKIPTLKNETLASLNDSGKKFKEIADIIEKEL